MLISLFVSIAFLICIYIARKPRPVTDRQGSRLNQADGATIYNQDKKTLTVASFNVQTGKNLQGQRDISQAAMLLQQVDFAGVQEVYAPSWANMLGLGVSQTESLAKPGCHGWLFCPTRYRWFRENRGNAILSKLPISSWQTSLLPDQSGISFRNMTVANFQWQGQNCYFINTHLHTSIGKTEQLQKVLKEFDKYSTVILVGDLNSTPENEMISNHLQSRDVTDAIHYCNIDSNEKERIDWIVTKGWKINSGKTIGKGVSDHPFYQVELELLL